jgi:hypothetical protein
MLSRSVRRFCDSKRVSRLVSLTTPDHMISGDIDTTEERMSVLLDELTRERLLVKSLRDENELLRGNISTLSQREAELEDLNQTIAEQKRSIESYSSRLGEQEIKFNNLRVDFEDYKKLVEIEKLKLSQTKALPLILAGVGGALLAYLVVRADMLLEKENTKFLKFELNQMWQARVRDIQSTLDEVREENERLTHTVNDLKAKSVTSWLSVAGKRII